jgi:hypothetical protein
MDVLVTGAQGTVGTAITDHLDDDAYNFTLIDTENGDGPGVNVKADIRDYDSIRPHFEGQDAAVHLTLIPGHGTHHSRDIGWLPPLSDNYEGIHNVYEAAVDADIDSIVFASSHHAIGMVEVSNAPDIYYDGETKADHTEPHRPDSCYGLTKCYGEDLGRLAAEAHDIRFYALRLGAIRDREYDHPYGDAERGVDRGNWERGSDPYEEQVARLKGLWQSRRDLAHLVECCLQDQSVTWDQFYGLSDNDRGWYDIEHARQRLGYDPQDNGEEWDAPPR